MMTKLFAFATSSLCSKVNLCALALSSYLGDIEKKHKLEISPLCDSEANTIASVQIGKNRNNHLCDFNAHPEFGRKRIVIKII